MIARLNPWYLGLTRRERVLVTVAGVLAAVLVLVYGVVLPLAAAHDAAHLRHNEAVQVAGRLQAQLALLDDPAQQSAPTLAGPVAQVVATSADAAGFVLQANQPQGNDGAVIVIPTARPAAALVWLDSLVAQGLVLEQLTMTPAADGTVAVNATLRRGSGA